MVRRMSAVGAVLGLLVMAPAAWATSFTGGNTGAIPDGVLACGNGTFNASSRDVTFTVFGLPENAPTDVSVTFSASHPMVGDLWVQLIAPNGGGVATIFQSTGAAAFAGCGDTSDLLGPYTFSDSGGSWWTAAAAAGAASPVLSGTYRASAGNPPSSTNTLITPQFSGATHPNGTWTLSFFDGNSNASTSGSVTSATLNLTVPDTTAPATPTLSITDPPSGSNNNSPKVLGAAESGSTVNLYSTAACTGSPLATATAAQLASPGIPIAVADNSSTSIRATATDASSNTSGCSGPITYAEVTPPVDSTAPDAPSLTATNPPSGSNDNTPLVSGTAEAASTVKLYTGGDCTGSPAATGSAAQLASPGIGIAVPDDSTTAIRAAATDAANNTSACSVPLNYTETTTVPPPLDKQPPTTTINSAPKAKTTSSKAKLQFSADETATFECKLTGKKAPASATTFAACTSPKSYSKLKPGKYTFAVHATDGAGNQGADATASWKVKPKS